MLDSHMKRLTRTAVQKEQDGHYMAAALKWRKAKEHTKSPANRDFYQAREIWCRKQHRSQQQQKEKAA